MDPSYKSNYDTASGFDSAYSYLTSKHPEVNNPDVIAWDIAKLLNENHVEPLLKNLQIIDQILTSIGIPKPPFDPNHPDWIDQIASRMRDVSAADLGGDEMQKLHELLNSLGVPMLDGNSLALSVGERFTIVATELSGLRAAMEGKDKNKSVAANEATSVIPPVGSAYRAGLPSTLVLPLADQLTPELEAIRDEIRTLHANQSDLSTQVAAIGKTIQEQVVQDEKQARQVKATMDALLRRTEAIERELERAHRERREESEALQQRIAENKVTIDRLSAVLASNNEDTQRQLIEEALDSFEAREAIKAMERQEDEDAEAGRPPRTSSPISQPIPQRQPASEPHDPYREGPAGKSSNPSTGAKTGTATKTATRPAFTGSRHKVREDQLRRQPIRELHPRVEVRPASSPMKRLFAGFTAILVIAIIGLASLMSTKSMVTLGTSQYAKVLQGVQVQYLTATEAVREKFPDVDLASTAMAAVTADNNAIYEAEALQRLETWLKVKGKTDTMQLAADNLEKAGGFRYTKAKTLDVKYGIRKDGAKLHAWQMFLGLLYVDMVKGSDATHDADAQAMWQLVDWAQGYVLPSKRGDRVLFYDKVPTLDEQYAIRYKHLLSDPPGPPKNCLLPPAVASLKGKVPASVIKAKACPAQHLTPALFTSFGEQYPGERELALKHPEKYWGRYCIVPSAITKVHNETNILVAELRAKACKS